jgi:hypothetical protein
MMRDTVRLGSLFLGTTLLAFVLVAPRAARSQTRSIGGTACPSQLNGTGFWDYSCPLFTDSTTHNLSALSGAWFDFGCLSSEETVVYKLKKFSSSGAAYFDERDFFCAGESNESQWVPAERILEYVDDDGDHLYADVYHAGPPQQGLTFYGVTACFSGGANDCL